jgi:hypothetical protein
MQFIIPADYLNLLYFNSTFNNLAQRLLERTSDGLLLG